MPEIKIHERYMQAALRLAESAVGTTSPNPSVGCIIVKGGRIIGYGNTKPGGRPHAEVVAINSAIEPVAGAIAYVTLEPCSHHGKTPPCAEALINAGIKTVVIANTDPNPLVAGNGIKMLEAAGVEVIKNVMREGALIINAPFFKRITTGKPYVTLKMAASSDNKIGYRGEKFVLSCEESRRYAHYLRLKNEAILVGVETVLNDNPSLNCRLNGLEQFSPVRVVLDTNLRITKEHEVMKSSDKIPTVIITTAEDEAMIGQANIIKVKHGIGGRLDLNQALEEIGRLGINSLLIEGGTKIAESFLNEGLVDRFELITTPTLLGDKGVDGINFENYQSDFGFEYSKDFGVDELKVFKKI